MRYAFFCLLFICGLLLSAQETTELRTNWTNSQLIADLDTFLPDLLQQSATPGLSLAIAKDDQIIYSKGLGKANIDTGASVRPETIFSAASLSKPVFAYAVLKLVEEDRFDLDKPLYRYLPYEDIAYDDRYKQITARMILSHTSGFPNWRNGRLDIRFTPGDHFSYSGEGFVYLMKVIEKVSGQSLEALMQEKVFKPLKMKRSSFVWQERFAADYAHPHDQLMRTVPFRKMEQANTAYSLQTTAGDYARFILAILNAHGLSQKMIAEMLTPQVQVTEEWGQAEPVNEEVGWGLGFGLQETPQGRALWHWGDNGTFKCFVIAYPGNRSGVVYFTNGYNGLSLTELLVRRTIGGELPARDWLNYESVSDPAFGLLPKILDTGYESAIQPFLTTDGAHIDPEVLDENQVNRLGYQLLEVRNLEAARKAFWSNVLAFPGSANVYDSYAEACLWSGQRQKAAQYYAIAAEMDPQNKTAAQVVRQLTQPQKGNLTFRLEGNINARSVGLAGEFNGWKPINNIMLPRNGGWECRLDLKPGTYQYKFFIDGVWILDPGNPESIYVDGNHNSVLKVEK